MNLITRPADLLATQKDQPIPLANKILRIIVSYRDISSKYPAEKAWNSIPARDAQLLKSRDFRYLGTLKENTIKQISFVSPDKTIRISYTPDGKRYNIWTYFSDLRTLTTWSHSNVQITSSSQCEFRPTSGSLHGDLISHTQFVQQRAHNWEDPPLKVQSMQDLLDCYTLYYSYLAPSNSVIPFFIPPIVLVVTTGGFFLEFCVPG